MGQTLLSLSSDLPDVGLALLTRDLRTDLLREGLTEARLPQGQAIGDKGDPVTVGTIVLAAFSGGAAVSLIKCVQAILTRDRSLRIKLKFPKGPEIQLDAKNIANKDLHAAIQAAVAAVGAHD